MKASIKKNIIGKVANNPRYDQKYGLISGLSRSDADAFKKQKEKTLYSGDSAKKEQFIKGLSRSSHAIKKGKRLFDDFMRDAYNQCR